jgi:hypothetical protein
MADKGQGIRLFNSKEALQSIFESFEDESDDEEDDEEQGSDEGDKEDEEEQTTRVSLSHMRDWVIQVKILPYDNVYTILRTTSATGIYERAVSIRYK